MWNRIRRGCALLLVIYLIAEFSLTAYERVVGDQFFFYLMERTETEPIVFDAASGYRFGKGAHRVAGVWLGELENSETVVGNNLGFPDRDDFTPMRRQQAGPRIGILGDSFTSAMHVAVNWPNRAEQRCRDRAIDASFMNFALDGTGLANWWSIVTKLWDKEGYELDAVVFAVYVDDLARRFIFEDSRGRSRLGAGRTATWNPRTFPDTFNEAKPLFRSPPIYIVESSQFDDLVGRRQSPFHLSLFNYVRTMYWVTTSLATSDQELDDPHRQRIIQDIAEFVRRRKLKAFLLFIPNRPHDFKFNDPSELIGWRRYLTDRYRDDFLGFGARLNATIIDSTEMYKGMTVEQLYRCWNTHEPHTSQEGSDRIAELVVERLLKEGTIRSSK